MSDNEEKPVQTRVCCARLGLHIVRLDKPAEGIEMTVLLGAVDERMANAEQVMLVDRDGNAYRSAKLTDVPDLRDAILQLARAAIAMAGRKEFAREPMPKTDGTVH